MLLSTSLYCEVNNAVLNDTSVSSAPATATAPSTGASFTATTEMFTASTAEMRRPSLTRNLMVSTPEKLAFGV